jgi:hypothetical protein
MQPEKRFLLSYSPPSFAHELQQLLEERRRRRIGRLPVQNTIIKNHWRSALAVQRMLPVHLCTTPRTRGEPPEKIRLPPVQPQRFQQTVLLIGRNVNRRQKISVGGSKDYWRSLSGSDSPTEIAQCRQIAMMTAKSPVRMEPDALKMIDRFAAM